MNTTYENSPDDALNRAVALHVAGDVAGAAVLYRQAMARYPGRPLLMAMLGTAELQLGNIAAAISLLQQSLQIAPSQPDTLRNLGLALQKAGRFEAALAAFDGALAHNPGLTQTYADRAEVLRSLKRPEAALSDYERAAASRPDCAEIHNNQGIVSLELKRPQDALDCFTRATAIKADFAEAHHNRGNALSQLNRPQDAVDAYDRAIALRPDLARAHYARGNELMGIGKVDDALASYRRALATEPDFADASLNVAVLELLKGDFAQGWRRYEQRWRSSKMNHLPFALPQPRWTGDKSPAGKTLLIRAEQGLGDTIQFCRYLPMVAALGAKVIARLQPAILPLFAAAYPDIECASIDAPLPDFDWHCAMLSLPFAFRTNFDSIPAKVPYLWADPGLVAAWRAKLGPKTRPRIGLAWSGSQENRNDFLRSIWLDQLAPLLALPFEFHVLQKDIRPEDDAALASLPSVATHRSELEGFATTAALIETMDLVISVDTSIAHLAGAMNKPVWIMLPFVPDWRWLLDRSDSPWYPSATLFRQPAVKDWAGTVAAVADRLRAAF